MSARVYSFDYGCELSDATVRALRVAQEQHRENVKAFRDAELLRQIDCYVQAYSFAVNEALQQSSDDVAIPVDTTNVL